MPSQSSNCIYVSPRSPVSGATSRKLYVCLFVDNKHWYSDTLTRLKLLTPIEPALLPLRFVGRAAGSSLLHHRHSGEQVHSQFVDLSNCTLGSFPGLVQFAFVCSIKGRCCSSSLDLGFLESFLESMTVTSSAAAASFAPAQCGMNMSAGWSPSGPDEKGPSWAQETTVDRGVWWMASTE